MFKGDRVRFPGGFSYEKRRMKKRRMTSKAFELSSWRDGVAIKRGEGGGVE